MLMKMVRWPLVVLTLMGSIAWAQVESRLDRSDIAEGETFTLVITQPVAANGGQFNLNVRRPSHAPLEQDFNVLGINNSSRVVANGNQSSGKLEWIYTLQPKRAGQLTVPALTIGQQQSPAIPLTVKPARNYQIDRGQQLFARPEVSDTNPYVQQQVLYTVKVFLNGRLGLSDFNMSQPTGKFAVQPLNEESRYRTAIGGEAFDVVERRWALFPQQSGELTITAPEFVAEFGGPSFFSRRSQKRLDIDDSTLTVQPQPAGFNGALWLPAKEFNVTASVSPPADEAAGYQTGEPITYTLSTTARGLTAAQLPEPPTPQLNAARAYPEDPIEKQGEQGGDIIGQRQRRIAIVPTRGGTLTLPAVELPWWNTETNRQETFRLAPFELQIAAAPVVATAPVQPTDSAAPISAAPSTAHPAHWMESRLWFFSTVLLLLLGLVAAALRWLQRNRDKEQQWLNRDNSEETKTMGLSARWHSLRSTLQGSGLSGKGDSDSVTKALASWSQAKWPEAGNHSPIAIAERLDPQGQMPELRRELGYIDQCQYGSNDNSGARWHGKQAWQALQAAVETEQPEPSAKRGALPGLYTKAN